MENHDIFNLDSNTQLEFLQPKTVLVIDKNKFTVCKQLMLQNAQDDAYASFLEIPIEKVRFFKYKMTLWENKLRSRRRAIKKCSNTNQLNAHKSSQERFKKARELVAKNLNTSEISKILQMSERSVTRFKKRMREEKRKLKAEGKLNLDPNDEDNSFKYLAENEKFRRAKELFQQGLRLGEISEFCKVSERTVRRWKDRLIKMEQEASTTSLGDDDENEEVIECLTGIDNSDIKPKQQRQRRPYFDHEKIDYAVELMQNGLSNKEMSMLLELSIANVRKLKVSILKGTVNELIDDSAEHYSRLHGDTTEGDDPLNGIDGVSIPVTYGSRRKAKVNLTDRQMHIVRLLKERGVRTMEIARMVEISERSVTRLLSKSKEFQVHQYGLDILDEVEELLGNNVTVAEEAETVEDEEKLNTDDSFSENFISKSRIGMDLIRMGVKPPEIAKMLEVTEKQVKQWKRNVQVKQDEECCSGTTYIIEENYSKDEYLQ